MKRKLLAGIMAVVMGLGLCACNFNNTGTETSGSPEAEVSSETVEGETAATYEKNEMVVGSMVEASSLDPAFNMDFGSYQVLCQICDSVLSLDKDGNIQDGLASYEQVDDTTYVYTFRQGIKFSDGTELTAEDGAFSIQHYMDPEVAGGTMYIFQNVESVEATDTYEMTVKLKTPDSTWASMLAGSYGLVFSKAAYEAVGKENFGKPEGGIIGSGAYALDTWELGVQTVLVKNENYEHAQDVDIEKVTILYFSDISAQLMALKTGQIDNIVEPDANIVPDIRELDNVDIIEADAKAAAYVSFNCATGPFSDKNVRKAVASAIDVNSLMVSQYGEDMCEEATSLYCPLHAVSYGKEILEKSSQEVKQLPYDLEAAKQYLAESEYADGFDCKIMCWGDAPSMNQCVAIQAMLKELNINVEVVQQTVDESLAAGYGFTLDEDGNRVYDMFIATWSMDSNEPVGFYDPMLSSTNIGPGGANFASYSNPEVDALIATAKQSASDEERGQAIADINAIVTEDVPYVVIGYIKAKMALNKRFSYDNFSAAWISNLHYGEYEIVE